MIKEMVEQKPEYIIIHCETNGLNKEAQLRDISEEIKEYCSPCERMIWK